MSVLPTMQDQRSTDPLVSVFEDEQKTTVFSALSEYFRQHLFCDVVVVVGHEIIRAHKVVLAASSRFFYNAFHHYPTLSTVDIERELAPHGITVVYEDLKLLIEMLYFEGTVEISPQRIETLLLMSQVMGIPSVIRFLRRIKESFMNEDSQRASLSPIKRSFVSVQMPPSLTKKQIETRSLTFEQHHSTSLFQTRRFVPPTDPNLEEERPSRSGSRATLTSLSSFPYPIHSPATMESHNSNNPPPILDSLDPSFLSQLNSLQANQIDDLESALLNHMHSPSTEERAINPELACSSGTKSTSLQLKKTTTVSATVEDSFNSTIDETPVASKVSNLNPSAGLDLSQPELLPILPPNESTEIVSSTTAVNEEEPKGSSTPIRSNAVDGRLTIAIPNNEVSTPNQELVPLESPSEYDTINTDDLYIPITETPVRESPTPAKSPEEANKSTEEIVRHPNDAKIPEDVSEEEERESNSEETSKEKDGDEVKIPLNNKESQSITLTVPGSSKSFTLNFSADTLNQMRNSFMSKQGGHKVKKKNAFTCGICSKPFPSKRMLAKHEKYHVEKPVTSCQECGLVFHQKWRLEQHLAKDHHYILNNQGPLDCKECGKQFQWHRNLLAHVSLHHHQREIRYRCKNCPLTFLKKKAFIMHHRERHKEAVEPWCSLCLEIFEGLKQREDHRCGKIEDNGRIFICHKHDPALEFRHQNDLLEHIKTSHQNEENHDNHLLQKSCPVCNKKFMLKKNLILHMKRFHEDDGSGLNKFQCQICSKGFLYKTDLESHENIHTGVKNFKCETCNKSYSSKKALYDHNKLVHAENKETFSCDICGKTLRDKYKLKYHMMVHSNKKNFKCSHCPSEFKGGENLRKHVVKYHKDTAALSPTTSTLPK